MEETPSGLVVAVTVRRRLLEEDEEINEELEFDSFNGVCQPFCLLLLNSISKG